MKRLLLTVATSFLALPAHLSAEDAPVAPANPDTRTTAAHLKTGATTARAEASAKASAGAKVADAKAEATKDQTESTLESAPQAAATTSVTADSRHDSGPAEKTSADADSTLKSAVEDGPTAAMAAPAEGAEAEANRAPPVVGWDAKAQTLSAEADAAPFHQIVDALAEAGVEVKPHVSWEEARISARFEALPINEAAQKLFGKTYVLTWTHEAADALLRPRIILLERSDESATEPGSAVAGAGAAPDAQTLRALANDGNPAELKTALESALRYGDDELRQQAIKFAAGRERLEIGKDALYRAALEDRDPTVRQDALELVVNYAVGVQSLDAIVNEGTAEQPVLISTLPNGDASLDTLNDAAQNDVDPNVRDAAQDLIDSLAARAQILSGLDQQARNWLFKEDVNGPLSEQLAETNPYK